MPYTKCPNCRKVQQINRHLLAKEIGCMSHRCNKGFIADEYRMHSGAVSKAVFFFVIGFAMLVLFRWVGLHSPEIIHYLG